MKNLLLLFFTCCYTCLMAQTSEGLQKGAEIRTRMYKSIGGEKAVKQLRKFNYTLVRTTYVPNSDSTITSAAVYTIDLRNRYISTSTQTPEGPVIKKIGKDGAWLIEQGQRKPLPQEEQAALERTFFYNFIPMLQDEQLQFRYVRSTIYNDRGVDIVRVTDPENPALSLDLFVDEENGQVLTSSKPGTDEGIVYPYYADELEYVPVGKGIIFPLVYKIYVRGSLTSEGLFKNVQVK